MLEHQITNVLTDVQQQSTSVKNTVHKTSDGRIHVTQLDMIGCDLPAVVKLWWKTGWTLTVHVCV